MPNFNALVRGMSKEQLGIFCRVLAMVVFEPDDRNSDEIGMHIAVAKKGYLYFLQYLLWSYCDLVSADALLLLLSGTLTVIMVIRPQCI